MLLNPFSKKALANPAPAEDFDIITPDDGADLARPVKSLLLSADANVKLTSLRGTTGILPLVKGYNMIGAVKIFDTDTDDVTIIGLI